MIANYWILAEYDLKNYGDRGLRRITPFKISTCNKHPTNNRFFEVVLNETIRDDHFSLLQYCFERLHHCPNIVSPRCAKNRRCESFHVISPLKIAS